MQIAVTVVAYESEEFISALLARIPERICGTEPIILVSDDSSTDGTHRLAEEWARDNAHRNVKVRRQERNLGYGGNQKASFAWAAREGADVAVLLHGDGQYPPEMIADLAQPIVDGRADAVFGSRMIDRGGARRGGMPIDRFVGNKILSRLLNALTGTDLTEWFSGFRAYRVSALEALPVESLSDGFDFDIALTHQVVFAGHRVEEVPIPTRYGGQISRVPKVAVVMDALAHAARAYRRRRAGRVATLGKARP